MTSSTFYNKLLYSRSLRPPSLRRNTHLMKLRCTPSERWIPEQSMHRNTPYEMLAQLGFLAAQSKHACWKDVILLEKSRERNLQLYGSSCRGAVEGLLLLFTCLLKDFQPLCTYEHVFTFCSNGGSRILPR